MTLVLAERTLVLNKNWAPITTTSVQQAFVLLCRRSALAICPLSYETFDLDAWLCRSTSRAAVLRREHVVTTPRQRVEKPEVILLRCYGGMPRIEVSFSRKNLYRRDGYACQYCGRRRPSDELSIDHVVPRSRGGQTTWENCVLACLRCNTKKANKSPKESGLALIRPPRKPSWSPLADTLPQAQPASWKLFLRDDLGLTGS